MKRLLLALSDRPGSRWRCKDLSFYPMTLFTRCEPLKATSFSRLPPSISALLKTCKTSRHLQQVHAQIVVKGLEQDHFVVTQFICVCNALRNLVYATGVFNAVHRPSLYPWNCLIQGHCQHSSVDQTLSVFVRMMRSETSPDRFTFPSLIKACSRGRSIRQGMVLQGLAVRFGLDGDVFVKTGLVDLYGKCMDIASARKVFDEMPAERNEVSWTAMAVGYVNVGDVGQAMKMFDEMPRKTVASWNAMISGFLSIGDLVAARKLFDEMPERNAISFTELINGYAKAGDMASAKALFEESPKIDVFAWSALISGYAQNGQPNEALNVFFELCSTNVKPDEFILTSVMSACSQIKNLESAKWIDSYVEQSSIDHCRPHIMAALIDMNAKCGNMERASWLFDKMPNRDLVTYCSLIQGLSTHGRGVEAVSLFARMLDEGLAPDDMSFTVVLTACSHAGLVNEGCYYFDAMRKRYSMVPSPNHYACMVDLLGRSGNTKAAYELLKLMPVESHAGAWGALLGACQLHNDVELAKEIGRHLSGLEPLSASNYVVLSNIHAASDQWLDVMNLRNEMKARGLRKRPGWTWL